MKAGENVAIPRYPTESREDRVCSGSMWDNPIPSRACISVSYVADSPVRVPAALLAEWAAPRTRRWQNWSTQIDYLRV